jgi:hypothetical protein
MSYTPSPGLNNSGNFTTTCDRYHVLSTGSPKQIALQNAPDFIYWQNIGIPTTGSSWTSALAGPVLKEAWWNSSYPNGYVWAIENTPSAATNQNVFFTTGGFSVFNTAVPMPYAPLTGGTSITAANPAVATIANTFSNGSVVRIQNATGMEQLNGFLFTISGVTGTSFQLEYLNSSSFASAATAFSAQLVQIPTFSAVPFANQITAVTSSGTSTIITLSVTNNFFVGGIVQVDIPVQYGMQGLGNGQLWQITAINTATNQITINANSSAFAPFAFPTSTYASTASAYQGTPQVLPYGQIPPYQPGFAQNPQWYLQLGSNVAGTAGGYMEIYCQCSSNIINA